MPASFESRKDVLLRYVLYSGPVVVPWLIRVYYTIYFVLCLPQPALLKIIQYYLYLRLWTGDKASVRNCNPKRTPEQSAKMRYRMCELVFFIVAAFYVDEDSKIMRPRSYPYTGSCELCTYLVEAISSNALYGTVDVKSRYWRVVGCLLCEVGDADGFILGIDMICSRCFIRFPKYRLRVIVHFPIALEYW